MSENIRFEWGKNDAPHPVLKLNGRLDATGAKELQALAMVSLKEEGKKNLVVDLAGVEFVASTGLGTFLLLTEEFNDAEGNIVFVNATAAVLQVVALLNIDQFLNMEESEVEAFKSMTV